MKVNIKGISDILDDRLCLVRRGILITILLLKEKDSKLTLAKAKTKISFLKHKKELISLHRDGFIIWSGYENAIKSLEKLEVKPVIIDVLGFMNNLYQRKFGPTEERVRLLNSLLEKYSDEEIKRVVSNRYSVWKDEPVMRQHLIPETVFRMSKFIKYLDEVNHTRIGESFLNASEIGLKHGDEISYEQSLSFIDTETYTIMFHSILEGKKGRGREETRYGKDLKRLLRTRENSTEKDFILTYIQK